MLFESVVTNTLYYGTAFVLYLLGIWTPTLIGIALLFGIGNAFDSIVSGGAFAYLLKKKKNQYLGCRVMYHHQRWWLDVNRSKRLSQVFFYSSGNKPRF